MFAKKKYILMVVTLLIIFTLGISTVAQASGFYSLSASPSSVTAYSSNNYWVNYSVSFGTDESNYYLMEVWHDGTKIMTSLNLQNGWYDPDMPDYWGDSSTGWHNCYFRVYQQAGYNNPTKVSGLLIDTQVSVYRQ